MARPREFDEQHAVDAAMNAFWDKGYEATSTQDLCTATGLGRSSIYNTFSSKHALFERSLDHYAEIGLRTRGELLESAEAGHDRIRALLEAAVADEAAGHRGCLMINTVAEFGERDSVISARMKEDARRHLELLTDHIRVGQADGSIDTRRNPAELAEFVHSTIGGLRLISRRGATESEMLSVAEIALSALAAR